MTECKQTFDGKHHWAPRHRLPHKPGGQTVAPTVRSNWTKYIGCVCGLEVPSSLEATVRAQLAETEAEKKRQISASRSLKRPKNAPELPLEY